MTDRRKSHYYDRCIRCQKQTKGDPFCSDACKAAQQAVTWGVPLVDLPVYKRLPRLLPVDKERV